MFLILSFLEIRAERRQKSISVEFSFATVFAFKHHVSAAYVIVRTSNYCMINVSLCFEGHITVPQNAVYFIYNIIYNGIYVRATCFDIVHHPQALHENRSKSCIVFLHCGIPNAYKFQLQKQKYITYLLTYSLHGAESFLRS